MILIMEQLTEYETLYRNRMKELAELWSKLKLGYIEPENINYPNRGYEVGKLYYIGYWAEVDECIDIKDGWIFVKGKD
jgi:signal recognition particle subunit SEC65